MLEHGAAVPPGRVMFTGIVRPRRPRAAAAAAEHPGGGDVGLPARSGRHAGRLLQRGGRPADGQAFRAARLPPDRLCRPHRRQGSAAARRVPRGARRLRPRRRLRAADRRQADGRRGGGRLRPGPPRAVRLRRHLLRHRHPRGGRHAQGAAGRHRRSRAKSPSPAMATWTSPAQLFALAHHHPRLELSDRPYRRADDATAAQSRAGPRAHRPFADPPRGAREHRSAAPLPSGQLQENSGN